MTDTTHPLLDPAHQDNWHPFAAGYLSETLRDVLDRTDVTEWTAAHTRARATLDAYDAHDRGTL